MKAGVLAELSEVATKGDSPEEPLSPTSSDAVRLLVCLALSPGVRPVCDQADHLLQVARARRLVEENRRLRDRLASAEKSTETLGRELVRSLRRPICASLTRACIDTAPLVSLQSELRGAHNVVVAERDSLQVRRNARLASTCVAMMR